MAFWHSTNEVYRYSSAGAAGACRLVADAIACGGCMKKMRRARNGTVGKCMVEGEVWFVLLVGANVLLILILIWYLSALNIRLDTTE